MSVTTATALPTVAPSIAPEFAQIVDELSDEFFERREEIRTLACTMLAKQHGFLLGPPGTGKSAMVEALCNRIIGGKFWSILMDRQLGKEESFGATDIAKYEKTGVWERDTADTLVDAHVVFVDEVGKAGPASLNPYLRAFNERQFRNGKTVIDLPLITAIGASNEYLEPELAAMWDRFLVRMKVNYLQETSSFAALLNSAVSRSAPTSRTTITLENFQTAVDYGVPAVKLPPGVLDSIVKLRGDLATESITPSDRRWKQSVRLLQASAYLDGRDAVDDDDLQILQHVLWDVDAEIATVTKKVLSLTSPVTRGALEAQAMLDEIVTEIDARKGQSSDTRAAYGGDAQFKVTEILKQLDKLEEDGARQGRNTRKLDGVRTQAKAVRTKIFIECLNIPEDRANKLAGK